MRDFNFFLVILAFFAALTPGRGDINCAPERPTVPENIRDVLVTHCTYNDSLCLLGNAIIEPADAPFNVTDTIKDPSQTGLELFDVYLIKPLDREKNGSVTIQLSGALMCDPTARTNVVVMVDDELDTPPSFLNKTYIVSVPENQPAGVNSQIVSGIRATDPDQRDVVTYSYNRNDLQKSLFDIRPRTTPEILDVYLVSPLDFELFQQQVFTITATDRATLSSTCEVVINVVNVQDTPPAFTALQYIGRVSEQAVLGTTVLVVTAADGDIASSQYQTEGTKPNDVYYAITEGGAGMFAINDSTGAILTTALLDIDNNSDVTNGLVVMTIKAEELNTSGEPQYGVSNATVQVLIQIEDANDNRPQFNSPAFSGTIREDAVLNEVVTIEDGGYISVYDIDQSISNNQFSIHLEKEGQPWDLLKSNIDSQYSHASLLIQLNKENGLMGLGDSHLTFQIVAQEIGNLTKMFPAVRVDMTVWIRAQTTPAPAPEPVINLPLSTSDIIVFIVGILLLLNIGLTIFICYVMRGGRRTPFSVFNRNSKYYVSAKKKPGAEGKGAVNSATNGDAETAKDVSKVESGQVSLPGASTDMNSQAGETEGRGSNTAKPINNTVAAAANRNRCDVTTVEDKMETSPTGVTILITNEGKVPSTNTPDQQGKPGVKESQERSEVALLNLLNDGGSVNRCDVTPIKTHMSPSAMKTDAANSAHASVANYDKTKANQKQETTTYADPVTDQYDIIPIEQSPSSLGQGLSNLLHKVQRKLAQGSMFDQTKQDDICDLKPLEEEPGSLESSFTSNGQTVSNKSSFSDKGKGDVVPLIKSSPCKTRGDKGNLQAQQNPAFNLVNTDETGGGVAKNKELPPNFILLPATKTEQLLQRSANDKPDKGQETIPLKNKNNTSTSGIQTGSLLPQNPARSQITQTGVPPVALALPSPAGTQYKEQYITVTNPVYESASHVGNRRRTANPTTKQSENNPTDASITYTTKIHHPTSPAAKRQADARNFPGRAPVTQQSMSSPGKPQKEATPVALDKAPGKPVTKGHPHSPEDSALDSVVSEIKQLHDEIANSPQPQKNSKALLKMSGDKSASQDYMAAAKDLLSTAKQTQQPKNLSVGNTQSPPTKMVTVQENEAIAEKNKPKEKLTAL